MGLDADLQKNSLADPAPDSKKANVEQVVPGRTLPSTTYYLGNVSFANVGNAGREVLLAQVRREQLDQTGRGAPSSYQQFTNAIASFLANRESYLSETLMLSGKERPLSDMILRIRANVAKSVGFSDDEIAQVIQKARAQNVISENGLPQMRDVHARLMQSGAKPEQEPAFRQLQQHYPQTAGEFVATLKPLQGKPSGSGFPIDTILEGKLKKSLQDNTGQLCARFRETSRRGLSEGEVQELAQALDQQVPDLKESLVLNLAVSGRSDATVRLGKLEDGIQRARLVQAQSDLALAELDNPKLADSLKQGAANEVTLIAKQTSSQVGITEPIFHALMQYRSPAKHASNATLSVLRLIVNEK